MPRLRSPRVPSPRRFPIRLRAGALWLLGLALAPIASGAQGTAPEPLRIRFQEQTLPALPSRAPVQREPLALTTSDDRLRGVAWLEGGSDRTLEVRFAPWDGSAWGLPERVAPPGPGSQLALAGAVAADGSVALVWSAFDGEDDEILWSLRGDGIWSPPMRLAADNAVPDITPALSALPGPGRGLLAAWSRFQEGQYRVVVSRFDGRRWSEPEAIGPPGSLFPGFEPAPDPESRTAGSTVLFRTARPRGWQAVELDRAWRPRRQARVLAATGLRPELSADGSGVLFRWTGADSEQPPPRGHTSLSAWSRSAVWENLP